MNRVNGGAIQTTKERCRVCYTCVRECPAKAIRINDGQAEVLAVRCIGCGNCVRVCSQKAKHVQSSVEHVRGLIACSACPVVAIVAPSFPAEFTDIDERSLVGMMRALGFAAVHEVGFGADLVARQYRHVLASSGDRAWIATTCPAVVLYVEKYHPHLVSALLPVVSPMVAMARAVRRLRGGGPCRIVFVGPCIAKKEECLDELLAGDVDAALTFAELRQMFAELGMGAGTAAPAEFDPPRAGKGALFALSRGLLQAAEIPEDLLARQIVSADGCVNFVDAVRAFDAGAIDTRILELLACEGCVMGAGMTSTESLFRRRASVSQYVRRKLNGFDGQAWERELSAFDDLDLTRRFAPSDQRMPLPTESDLCAILAKMGKNKIKDELNCGACGYHTCREHAVAIYSGLAECEMCLPYTIDRLNRTVEELAASNESLAGTQEALMQSERLASMGQLAAGIAHEINNPLGVVIMYAHLLLEDLDSDSALRGDASMIAEQADRCRKIVSGLLHFARQNRVLRERTDMRQIVTRSIRAVVKPENIKVEVFDKTADPIAQVDADQLIQVITNLISNAYAAMPEGGKLTVGIAESGERVLLSVKDTGTGIPAANLAKIFEPFFTTKQIGKGTGLGLAVAYGVVKMHCGDIRVSSNADPSAGPTGTTFVVELPRKEQQP